jgi:hypothetical protein
MATTNGILRRQDTRVYLEHGLPQYTQLVKIQMTTLRRKDLLLLKKNHKFVTWLEGECVEDKAVDMLVAKALHQFLPAFTLYSFLTWPHESSHDYGRRFWPPSPKQQILNQTKDSIRSWPRLELYFSTVFNSSTAGGQHLLWLFHLCWLIYFLKQKCVVE